MALTARQHRIAARELDQVLAGLGALSFVTGTLRADLDQAAGLLRGVKERLAREASGADLREVLEQAIALDGGELLIAPLPAARPKVERWLTPAEAGVAYRQVWTARTAGGQRCRVRISSHRKTGGRRRSWFGLNLDTSREVRVVSVLEGSEI